MSTRTRQSKRIDEDLLYNEFDENLDLETLSDEELEEILFEDETETKQKGPFNLPTMAGLSMIVVGIAYLLQQLGVLGGISLGAMVSWLPWLAGVLIILLGFGVLSWRPDKKKKRRAAIARRRARAKQRAEVIEPSSRSKTSSRTSRRRSAEKKSRLRKSNDRKIAGVASGLAEYFNLDPTLVRIAFVIATFFNGVGIAAYVILALVMSSPEKRPSKASKARSESKESKVTIIDDR